MADSLRAPLPLSPLEESAERRYGIATRLRNGQPVSPNEGIQADLDALYSGGEFVKGLRRSGYSALEASRAFGGQLQELINPEAGLRTQQQAAQNIADMPKAWAPAVAESKDVNSIGSAMDYAAGAIGEGLPSTAIGLAGGLGGRALKGVVGGLIGGAAPLVPMEGGGQVLDTLNDPVAMQQPAWKRAAMATAVGVGNALLENTPEQALVIPSLLGRGITAGAGIGNAVRNVGLSALRTGAAEGGEEGLQDLTGQAALKYLNPQSQFDFDQTRESMIKGAVAGAPMGAVGGAVQSARDNIPFVPEESPKPKAELPNSFDGIIGALQKASDNPEQFGADAGTMTLGALSKAREELNKGIEGYKEGIGPAVEKFGDFVGQTAADVNAFVAENIQDPAIRDRFIQDAASLGAKSFTDWQAFKLGLKATTGQEFKEGLGIAAGTVKNRVEQEAPKAFSWLNDAVKGFYETTFGDTNKKESREGFDPRPVIESLSSLNPVLAKTLSDATIRQKRSIADIVAKGVQEPSLFTDEAAEFNPKSKRIMDEWERETNTHFPSIISALMKGENEVATRQITRSNIQALAAEQGFESADIPVLQQLASTNLEDLSDDQFGLLEVLASKNKDEVAPEELHALLVEKTDEALKGAEREEAGSMRAKDYSTATGEASDDQEFDMAGGFFKPQSDEAALGSEDPELGSLYDEDGNKVDVEKEEVSPFNTKTISESLADPQYKNDTGTWTPVTVRGEGIESFAESLGKELNEDGSLTLDISPMSLAATALQKDNQEAFAPHVSEYSDKISIDENAFSRYTNLVASLASQGIEHEGNKLQVAVSKDAFAPNKKIRKEKGKDKAAFTIRDAIKAAAKRTKDASSSEELTKKAEVLNEFNSVKEIDNALKTSKESLAAFDSYDPMAIGQSAEEAEANRQYLIHRVNQLESVKKDLFGRSQKEEARVGGDGIVERQDAKSDRVLQLLKDESPDRIKKAQRREHDTTIGLALRNGIISEEELGFISHAYDVQTHNSEAKKALDTETSRLEEGRLDRVEEQALADKQKRAKKKTPEEVKASFIAQKLKDVKKNYDTQYRDSEESARGRELLDDLGLSMLEDVNDFEIDRTFYKPTELGSGSDSVDASSKEGATPTERIQGEFEKTRTTAPFKENVARADNARYEGRKREVPVTPEGVPVTVLSPEGKVVGEDVTRAPVQAQAKAAEVSAPVTDPIQLSRSVSGYFNEAVANRDPARIKTVAESAIADENVPAEVKEALSKLPDLGDKKLAISTMVELKNIGKILRAHADTLEAPAKRIQRNLDKAATRAKQNIKVGDTVYHESRPELGAGVVTESDGKGNRTVKFPGKGNIFSNISVNSLSPSPKVQTQAPIQESIQETAQTPVNTEVSPETTIQEPIQATEAQTQEPIQNFSIVRMPFNSAPAEGVVDGHRHNGKHILNAKPGERGWLGNPFVAEDAGGKLTRAEAVAKYKEALYDRASKDPEFANALQNIRGQKIGYYKPGEKDVHLSAINDWLNENPAQTQEPIQETPPGGGEPTDLFGSTPAESKFDSLTRAFNEVIDLRELMRIGMEVSTSKGELTEEQVVSLRKQFSNAKDRLSRSEATVQTTDEKVKAALDALPAAGLKQKTAESWIKKFLGGKGKIRVIEVSKNSKEFELLQSAAERPLTKARGIHKRLGDTNYIVLFRENQAEGTQLATLAHEFGHAIHNIMWERLNTKTKNDLIEAWKIDKAEFLNDPSGHFANILSASKAFNNEALIESIEGGKFEEALAATKEGLSKTSPEYKEYLTSFEEWMAEQFNKYVENNMDRAISAEERSFWESLRATLQKFFTDVVSKFQPNLTYKQWIEALAAENEKAPGGGEPVDLFTGTQSSEQQAPPGGGEPTDLFGSQNSSPPKKKDGSQKKSPAQPPATPPTPPSGTSSPAPKKPGKTPAQKAFIDRVEKLLGKRVAVLFDEALENNARGTFQDIKEALDGIRNERRSLLNDKKIDGPINRRSGLTDKKIDAKIEKILAKEQRLIKDKAVLGVIKLAAGAENNIAYADHESLHAAFEFFFSKEERRIIATAFTQGPVAKKLKEYFKNDPGVLAALENGEEAAAYGFQLWVADPSILRVGPKTESLFQKLKDWIYKVLSIMDNNMKAEMIFKDFSSGERAKRGATPVQRVLDKNMTTGDKAIKLGKDAWAAVEKLYDVIFTASYSRLHNSTIPPLAKIAELGYQAQGMEGNSGGLIQRMRNESQAFQNRVNKILGDLTEEQQLAVHDALIFSRIPTRDPLVKKRAEALRSFYAQMLQYQRTAGVDIGEKRNYYPLAFDPEKVAENKEEFLKMLRQPKYADKIATLMKTPDEIYDSITSYLDRGEDLVDVMGAEKEPVAGHARARTLDFIDVKDRRQFMEDDPVHTAVRYIKQATRQAEFVRSYDANGAKLEKLIAEAKTRYGATADDEALARDYVNGLMGNKEVGMSRELKDLFGALLTYQNLRLLPLAVFSSLVDPLGVAIRTNSVEAGWETFTYSMKNMFKEWKDNYTRDQWEQIAQDWGLIADSGTVINAYNRYDGMTLSGRSKDINDKLFKYNLLSGWIRNNTVMAVKAAQLFMQRSAEDFFGAEQSARYLEELGLTKADIIFSPSLGRIALRADEIKAVKTKMSKEAAQALEEKLRNATEKVVRQALLNPSSAETPPWVSNPYLAPIAHLKQFVWSFNMTITQRITHEMSHGNFKPALIASLYVPGMIAADFMKDMIVNAGEEPPYKKDWGAADYLKRGVERSGLTGTGQFLIDSQQDLDWGGGGYESFAGATLQQARKGLKAVGSDNPEAMHKWIVEALPAYKLYDEALL